MKCHFPSIFITNQTIPRGLLTHQEYVTPPCELKGNWKWAVTLDLQEVKKYDVERLGCLLFDILM